MAKAASPGALRVALRSAAESFQEVRVVRSIRRSDKIEGFVVALGSKWVLLALRDDRIFLDGYSALRLDDITRVDLHGGPESFVGRALALRGQWPPTDPHVALDKTAELIRSAAETSPLVTLHVEVDDPGVCYIGRPLDYTTRSTRRRRSPSPSSSTFAGTRRAGFTT